MKGSYGFAPQNKANILFHKIQEKIRKYPKLLCGVYIKTNYSKDIVDIKGENQFPAASLIKLPIAVIILQEIESGKIRFDEKLTINRKNFSEGSGVIRFKKIGSKIKLKEVFEKMLIISDNTAFNMLVDRLGGISACNKKISGLGLKNTYIVDYLGDFKGKNKVSPKDLTALYEGALNGNLLKKEKSKSYLKNILLDVKNKSLISTGLKKRTKLAHKTGTIGICVGDAGVIYKTSKKQIYLSIIVRRPFNDLAGKRLIGEIANITFNEL